MLVPCAPCTLAIPSTAISLLVSKPRPNRTPSGYIFHGLSMNLKTFLKSRTMIPPPSKSKPATVPSGAACRSPTSSSRRTTLMRCMSFHNIQALPIPSKMRTPALTPVPIIFPTFRNPSNLLSSAPLVAATTIHVIITIVECPRLNQVPTVTGFEPVATRRRVMRSIADIWSASRACRRPKVYERRAFDAKRGCERRTIATTAHMMRFTRIMRAIIRIAG
jgi:hypothetical protein